MKKFLLLFVMILLLTTGCTKNYKTVAEYSKAMSLVRETTPSYTIVAKHKLPNTNEPLYYKSYIKGNKWKTLLSMNNGSSYMSTVLYDGVDVMSYTPGSPYAVDGAEYTEGMDASDINPVSLLLSWTLDYEHLLADSTKVNFVNNNDNKNGFECRMIQFSNERKICVSDKYGIATHYDVFVKGKSFTTLDLLSVDTKEIPDSEFQLPPNVKKMNMNQILSDIDRTYSKYKL